MSNRTYQCERCFQTFDRFYTPEIKYDEFRFCPSCFLQVIKDDSKEFNCTGHMLTIEAYSIGETAEEITDEEYMDCITYHSYKDIPEHPELLMI